MQNRFLNGMGKLALIALLVSNLALLLVAESKPKGNGGKHGAAYGHGQGKGQKDSSLNEYWENPQEQDRFRDWLNRAYGRSYPTYNNVPANILSRNGITRAEFEALPPGIQKNVMRGKPIPPGLQPGYRLSRTDLNRVSPVSDAILDTLGIPRDRYYYSDGRRVGRLDNDAIIYNPATGLIFDVLRGIF